MKNDDVRTQTTRPWPDPAELEHMPSQFKLGYRQAQQDAGAEIRRLLIQVWHIAKDGCLVPPDGGSPTTGEVEVSTRIANRIREMIPDTRLPILGGNGQ